MLSFNHYAYGAMIDWVYRNVGGLAPTRRAPGLPRIVVAPRPATGDHRARASIETRLGRPPIDWRLVGAELELDLEVPFGADAVLDLPGHGRVRGRGRRSPVQRRAGGTR